jgi:hypothetical protein
MTQVDWKMSPEGKKSYSNMYIIVFKDINETKNHHQYASQVIIFSNDLEN